MVSSAPSVQGVLLSGMPAACHPLAFAGHPASGRPPGDRLRGANKRSPTIPSARVRVSAVVRQRRSRRGGRDPATQVLRGPSTPPSSLGFDRKHVAGLGRRRMADLPPEVLLVPAVTRDAKRVWRATKWLPGTSSARGGGLHGFVDQGAPAARSIVRGRRPQGSPVLGPVVEVRRGSRPGCREPSVEAAERRRSVLEAARGSASGPLEPAPGPRPRRRDIHAGRGRVCRYLKCGSQERQFDRAHAACTVVGRIGVVPARGDASV